MKVINKTNNLVLADKAEIAKAFLKRLIGLLNHDSLNEGEALILLPSNSIHSFFMRFTIDALFLDKNKKIVGILPSFKPFRISPVYFNSILVIELPDGIIEKTQTKLGDVLEIAE